MYDLCNSDNLLIIRTNINQLCKYQGIKLKQVSEYIGMNESYFREVWSGKRKLNIDVLSKVAQILNTTPDYLCGLTNNPVPPNGDIKPILFENVKQLKPSYDNVMHLNNDIQDIIHRLSYATDEELKLVSGFMDLIGIKRGAKE